MGFHGNLIMELISNQMAISSATKWILWNGKQFLNMVSKPNWNLWNWGFKLIKAGKRIVSTCFNMFQHVSTQNKDCPRVTLAAVGAQELEHLELRLRSDRSGDVHDFDRVSQDEDIFFLHWVWPKKGSVIMIYIYNIYIYMIILDNDFMIFMMIY